MSYADYYYSFCCNPAPYTAPGNWCGNVWKTPTLGNKDEGREQEIIELGHRVFDDKHLLLISPFYGQLYHHWQDCCAATEKIW